MLDATFKILVIDENRIRASIIEAGLRDAGHDQVFVLHELQGAARRIADIGADVIVIDLENPGRDTLESMFQRSRSVRRPIVMFVDQSDKLAIEAAIDAGVSAYVIDGLKQERVKPILDMAVMRFNAFARFERDPQDARNELQERRVIERAKGILMKTRGLCEEEAYSLLRRTAMDHNKKIGEIARSLVTAADLLGDAP